ncbi:MAG: excinuclease ABC subunit UvrB [Patescibacteria group bacterium]
MHFKLESKFKPAGDQPKAIEALVGGLGAGKKHQTLLGVTGSGKTFTIANVIERVQRPTLVVAHNKTLAAQLCSEFREFFPKSAVEYFVSYYDYYQPEAYLPTTDTYIEKEAMINDEIDRLRHAATQALLTRRDVIIVASVSCIYGLGAPEAYRSVAVTVRLGEPFVRAEIIRDLTNMQFNRTNADLTRGTFRFRGEVLEVMPVNQEIVYRVVTSGGLITEILALDPVSRNVLEELSDAMIFPARHFVTLREELQGSLAAIRAELNEQLKKFRKEGKLLEAERLERRTRYDVEMLEQVGFCHGVENYSRHLSGRAAGEPPETLLSYFPEDYLLVIDESHVTVPQLAGMYEGDASRKRTLVEHGFRLPSAADNRPLKFAEFEARMPQAIYTSATPGKYEMQKSKETPAPSRGSDLRLSAELWSGSLGDGTGVVEQIIRPTGLVDPEIIIHPVNPKSEARNPKQPNSKFSAKGGSASGGQIPNSSGGQVADLIERIKGRVERNERVLVTTLTKKMAEDLTEYLGELSAQGGSASGGKVRARYLHSDVDTLDRIQILTDFRKGAFDVLVGVNLLREGLDLPEVTLVAILDADKEGFLRSETSLIQTIGRAARNVRGQVVLYADQMTGSLERAIRETERRRAIQLAYNKEHGITPKTITKAIKDITEGMTRRKEQERAKKTLELETLGKTGDIPAAIREKEKEMKQAALALDFELAAVVRDEIKVLKGQMRRKQMAK